MAMCIVAMWMTMMNDNDEWWTVQYPLISNEDASDCAVVIAMAHRNRLSHADELWTNNKKTFTISLE